MTKNQYVVSGESAGGKIGAAVSKTLAKTQSLHKKVYIKHGHKIQKMKKSAKALVFFGKLGYSYFTPRCAGGHNFSCCGIPFTRGGFP